MPARAYFRVLQFFGWGGHTSSNNLEIIFRRAKFEKIYNFKCLEINCIRKYHRLEALASHRVLDPFFFTIFWTDPTANNTDLREILK